MGKEGEIRYLEKAGETGRRHAANKPFSDSECPDHLADISAIMSLLPPPPARLLDLGCGTGWTSRFFARRGYDVVGVDIAGDMIAEAMRQRTHAGLANLVFLECDYEHLDFRGEFDIVVFFDSLHHAVDEGLAVRRAFEALKPGGLCVTHEPGEGHAVSTVAVEAVERFGVTEKDMPPRKVTALGREAGFSRFHVFPLPRENYTLAYRLDTATQVIPESYGAEPTPIDLLSGAGWLKRLFHRVVRRRFGFSPLAYSALLARLAQVNEACENRYRKSLASRGALVVMVK